MFISLLPQFFFFSLLLISRANFSYAYTQCMHDQKTLLLDFRTELKFDYSRSWKLVRWNQTDNCCRWEGVECDGVGHVISLQLDNESIYGGLKSSSSLFSLRYLKKLSLALNMFNENQIPREIGNLTCLTHLDLSYAGFGGQIPMELSLLKRLVSVDYSYNYGLKLEYPSLGMVLRNLTGLKKLYLDGVDISGEKVEWYNIISSSLPTLKDLSLCGCSLSSPSDPSLLRFHSLTHLGLDRNNLSTIVPNFFVNFSSLTYLSLHQCSLKGSLGLSHKIFFGSNLVYLDLSSNSLSGNIPISLFGLLYLQRLDLSDNQFSGQVHEFLTQNFSNIKYLSLRSNQLEGPIPDSFFQLPSIETLDLAFNLFNATFQLEKIKRLPKLGGFDVSYNNLTVDASNTNSSLSLYPQLSYLYLASCNLYYFPDFIKFQTLRQLDLSNNRISGEIPSWIWQIGNGTLAYLNLSCNLLVDFQKPFNIPASLQWLDLHSNQLHGELPLPPQGAYDVDFSNNNFDKPIPTIIANFSSSLTNFNLKNSSISGSIPSSLCNYVSLQVLNLSLNKLTGSIPHCLLNNMKSLRVLDLSLNKLTGSIPHCLPNSMSSLQVLDLSLNKLSGKIPSCLLENIVVLNLGRNNISGEIPDKFSVNCIVKTLELSHNNLTGHIPLSLASCKRLEVLNVGNNKIDDTFPCMLSSSLHVLVLRSNRFYGEVGCHSSFPNLQIIDVSSNNFNGTLHPKSFSSWKGMMAVSDAQLGRNRSDFKVLDSGGYYRNEVTLTIKGVELNLVKIWPDFTSIDFSCNNFKGEIPEAIGDLTSLYLLNLSHNTFSGEIPRSLGKLRELGSLDLSKNELRGVIPMELAKLTFLQVLNVSYNKLVGEIPNGPQLQTFSSDFFKGNNGLCGKLINISCRNMEPGSSVELEEKMEMMIEWEYVSVVLGYVVGLGSFVWVLFGCINFRDIYFREIDDILENIFIRHNRRRTHGRKNQVRRRYCC